MVVPPKHPKMIIFSRKWGILGLFHPLIRITIDPITPDDKSSKYRVGENTDPQMFPNAEVGEVYSP